MDASLFKDVTTSRGLKYHYYFSPAQFSKPTLLFCHGFPSKSSDWSRITPFFKERGYGVLVVDQLGYDDTAKPTDPETYVSSLISKDIIDVLDAEKLDKVIAIGHDWGVRVTSRLASYYPERFIAYAFLAVAFWEVTPPEDFQSMLDNLKKLYGSELFGYWAFLSEPDADKVVEEHLDSFFSVWFPHDPTIWKTRLAPLGALKQSLLENYQAPLPPYVSEEDKAHFLEYYRRNGFKAATCWYKVITSELAAKDDQQILPERRIPPASSPIFWAAALNDYVTIPALGEATFAKEEFKNHSITRKDYDSDHWVLLSRPDELARDLEAWIEDVVVLKAGL